MPTTEPSKLLKRIKRVLEISELSPSPIYTIRELLRPLLCQAFDMVADYINGFSDIEGSPLQLMVIDLINFLEDSTSKVHHLLEIDDRRNLNETIERLRHLELDIRIKMTNGSTVHGVRRYGLDEYDTLVLEHMCELD